LSGNIENEISSYFKTDESCLCDVLILKSIFDLKDYPNNPSKCRWIGVSSNDDSLIVDLDFFSSRLAYYYWQPCFYFQLSDLYPTSNIDMKISEILIKFESEYKKNLGITLPKITFMCSKSTKDYREKIKNEIQKQNIILKLSNKLKFIKISHNDTLVIKKEIFSKINEHSIELLDKIFRKFFPQLSSLLPNITIEKQKRPDKLPISTFKKIQSIQTSCFYCKGINFNVQEHVIPIQLFGKTVPSNIVASCDACNNSKWLSSLPREIFDEVLQRNESNRGILEPVYDSITYEKIYELFRKGNRPVWKDKL
jgi:hypothetical protein